jgi:ElaB/YqjD/DUF883 family membrane-anchored ribosome-binding protein
MAVDAQEETMFARQHSRTRRAERIAGQAWDELVGTVDGASATARTRARNARHEAMNRADDMSDRVGSAAKEARRRAGRAYDALAGRTPPRPWGWLAAAAAVGVVVGWIGTLFGREMAARGDLRALTDSVTEQERAVDRAVIRR